MSAHSPEVGIVVYGASPSRLHRLRRWASAVGTAHSTIIENKAGAATQGVLQGDNKHSEFSAYLQLCSLFRGDGPYLIINDTLVRTHWAYGWARLCRKLLRGKLDEHTIIGDIRNDGDDIAGKPSVYLASWIFIIPSRKALEAFRAAMEQALTHPETLPSAYDQWLHRWLNPGSLSGGWHHKAGEAEKRRKRFCIITEHRLSQQLSPHGLQMVSAGRFSPALYFLIRLADRLKTRLSAAITRLKTASDH
ncbi:MAG: hypothetical protein LWX09_05095 [Bacteroidia bacterium]|nr:hypothetical protein [Bacteroidia bacterium]